MSQSPSSNSTSNDQVKVSSDSKNQSSKIRRRLDHLSDLQEGIDKFDMVPRCLSRAYFDGKFPEPKYKILRMMMSHGEYFRVKRAYLEDRISRKTIVKYLPELIVEGYIDRETLSCLTGGTMNVYHVRPITDWLVYRQNVDSSLGNGSPGNGSPGNPLKDTNSNETEFNDPNSLKSTQKGDLKTEPKKEEKPKKAKPEKDPFLPTKGTPENKEAVRDMVVKAKEQGLIVQPNSLALSVDNCIEKLGTTISVIREVWPLAIVGMLEKGNVRPASAFFNWMRFELKMREKAKAKPNYQKAQSKIPSDTEKYYPGKDMDAFEKFQKKMRGEF